MAKQPKVDALPQASRNKKYEKDQKFKEKRRMKELQRENPQAATKIEKLKLKKAREAKKAEAAVLATKAQPSGRRSKKAAATATSSAKAAVSDALVAKKKKKDRRPKTVVSNAPTGRETLVKKKARALVAEKREEKKANLSKDHRKNKPHQYVSDNAAAEDKGKRDKKAPAMSPEEEATAYEKLLIARTIRGGSDDVLGRLAGHNGTGLSSSSSVVRSDPSLYPPEVAFYEDYAEKKQTQSVSEDALLKHAHDYFKKVGHREKQLNVAAANYLRKMKEVNRKGGDKDGFRYVVPKNVKDVVKLMRQNEQLARGGDAEAMIDDEQLVSTFGGSYEEQVSDKPMRRHRKRPSTYSNFYQFQVSKRWTQNAESFLNRGRAHKSLFEAKKRQRSIKKL